MAKDKSGLKAPRLNAYKTDPDELTIIGLDTNDGPEHPLYDERVRLKLDEGLVRNIMWQGVIEPITVTKDADGRVLVVVGRQRVRAAREANKRLKAEGKVAIAVPAMTRRGEQAGMYGVMISENENRQDDNMITKARKAAKMINVCHAPVEDVIKAFKITPAKLNSYLKLLELEPSLVKAIERGEVSASQALEKAGAGAEAQRALASEVRGKKANGRGRPKGATAKRPGKVQIEKMLEKLTKLKRYEHYVPFAKWVLGQISEDEFFA